MDNPDVAANSLAVASSSLRIEFLINCNAFALNMVECLDLGNGSMVACSSTYMSLHSPYSLLASRDSLFS